MARHQVAQKELLRVEAEIESKKQKVVQYAAQLRRSQEDIANVLRKHRVVLQNAKQKSKGRAWLSLTSRRRCVLIYVCVAL